MVAVFRSFAPAPGSVCAHEEDLAGAEGSGDEDGDAAVGGLAAVMAGEHFGAVLGSSHGCVPLETGEGCARCRGCPWRRLRVW